MSFKKFEPNDIILNTMKTHPSCEFFIFDGAVFYNNRPAQSGAFSANVPTLPGYISLYEYNTDRVRKNTGTYTGPENTDDPIINFNVIYPYITKQGSGDCFSTVSDSTYSNEFTYGDVITGSYPMTASITRELMTTAGSRKTGIDSETGTTFKAAPIYPHYYALKNRLEHLTLRSAQFRITGSVTGSTYAWIKDQQTINLISIPSIFYGSTIQPGSLSLKWYFTGSLIGELQDSKRNGELIQVGPAGSTGSGSVAGVAMYDEGFILLTGSWDLNNETIKIKSDGSGDKPKWIYFGAGANDGVTQASAGTSYYSASFNMSFRGQTNIQVMTMFAHAKKGEVNFSNNPTFLKYGQNELKRTSSMVYEENPDRLIANTVSSSYSDYSASFKRQVYVSKVVIYDENKNLMGVATLANPVRKEEDQDLTFKLRLDI